MALQLAQRIIFLILICCVTTLHAQTVYYPSQSSDLLKLTATDVAALFNKAIPNSKFTTQEYTYMPQSGFVFIYDSTMINDQSCKIECNGALIKFSAAQDAGLCFGIYNYLNELGFRFYLPGTLWEKMPTLTSPYKQENRTVVQKFKYNNWFISGGYNKWAMDQDASFGDAYFGKNGHEWSQYQRRNNMNSAYRFSGHRGDILNTEYLSTLQANPCYIACNNGERKATSQSVPDINNNNAKEYWASAILKQYTIYKNSITSDPALYKNFYRNFNYYNEYIGIEVPDGSAWGNSTDNLGCEAGNYNGNPYPNASDQQFILANFTASRINNLLPEKHFQCYAYAGHADVPSYGIPINKNIDVQVVASAFQSETSSVGLLSRWYKKYSNISEYDYMNIPQWTGETPIFSLNNYKNTLVRIKQNNGQGIVIEASPAKFASLPFLFAGNRYLQYDVNIDSSLNEFTSNLFPANIAVHIKQLLNYWGDDNVMLGGKFINDNKYKISLFLQELYKAVTASQNTGAEVIARLQEFKAYVHYIILYYDFIQQNKSYQNKTEKAANLCLYLAKINKLQLVNSYFLIYDIVNKYPDTSAFYKSYNIINGSAYMNGNLALISNEQINNNFSADLVKYGPSVTDFKFDNAVDIINKLNVAGLKPMDKINVGIGYTNGFNYPNRCEFYFYAPAAGMVNIHCIPTFEMPGYSYLNFTVEAADKGLVVIKDETLTREKILENINFNIPSVGLYKLSVVSKFKSSCDLVITTNGNTFFKGPFYGKGAENYHSDTLKSLPKYFYVPSISQLYFSINNACYTNRCLSPDEVENAFGIKDNNGKAPVIEVSPFDSSLYKISIPAESAGTFWQVTKFREYNFCFANISNIEIFAEPKDCGAANFTATIINKEGNCFTRITALSNGTLYREWNIADGGKQFHYTMLKTVDLPVLLSPNAIISLSVSGYCSASKRTADIKNYVQNIQACTSSASQVPSSDLIVYPNPSSSVFNFKKNSAPLVLNKINVYDPQGKKIVDAVNTSSINLSDLPAGIYIFSAQKENDVIKGKLIKN